MRVKTAMLILRFVGSAGLIFASYKEAGLATAISFFLLFAYTEFNSKVLNAIIRRL